MFADIVAKLAKPLIKINRAICHAIESRLASDFTKSLLYLHELKSAEYINRSDHRTVLDVGAGVASPFARRLERHRENMVVGTDILWEDLTRNRDVEPKFVCNASATLPLQDRSVDTIVSRSVVEHLPDVGTFLKECSRVLRPGGYLIQVFPCRYAPFAILNRILPNRFVKSAMAIFHPEWSDECGFRAYYNQLWHGRFMQLLAQNGFSVVECHKRYYQAIYYTFFFPLYLLMVAYDLLVYKIGAKNLSCQLLIVARLGPPPSDGSVPAE